MNTPMRPLRFRKSLLSHAVSLLAVLVFAYPVLWILLASVKPEVQIYREPLKLFPGVWDFSIFSRLFSAAPIATYLANSLLYSIGAVVISLSFALCAAYGLSRHQFRGKQLLLILILVVQMIPALEIGRAHV